MTVRYSKPSQVSASAVLFAKQDAVEVIAHAAVVNAIEFAIDMILDFPADYPTKADIEAAFGSANEQAVTIVSDAVDELKAALIERLMTATVDVRVTAMRFSEVDGRLNDVDARVAVE